MVGSADLDGVDIVPVENLAKVGGGGACAVSLRGTFAGIMLVDEPAGRFASTDLSLPVAGALAVGVADCDQLHTVVAEERFDVVKALVTGADHRQRDAVARGGPTGQAQRGAGDDRGKCQTGRRATGRLTQESTARRVALKLVHLYVSRKFKSCVVRQRRRT